MGWEKPLQNCWKQQYGAKGKNVKKKDYDQWWGSQREVGPFRSKKGGDAKGGKISPVIFNIRATSTKVKGVGAFQIQGKKKVSQLGGGRERQQPPL